MLVLSHTWISLSWLHSVQELEKSKLLLLYYDMHEVGNGTRPKIESLVVEFSREALMQQFLTAVSCLHEKYHDEDVEKVYHFLC